MISGLTGKLTAKLGDRVTVATAGGVSYSIAVPLGVLERLPEEGSEVELRTALVVREDSLSLFGFDGDFERDLFQRLLGATGVGPRLALALLSTLGGEKVIRALKENNLGALCTVPGVGRKTAQRLVVELKDRVADLEGELSAEGRAAPVDLAVQALVNLGYSTAQAEKAVSSVLATSGSADAAELIRKTLQTLVEER